MRPIEVEFELDERALLNVLQSKAKKDAAVVISDTVLLQTLGWTEAAGRFFAAKMRLVTAGAITLHVDGQGHQLISLNMPERTQPRSTRYVFTIVPFECLKEVRQLIKQRRTAGGAVRAEGPGTKPASAAGPGHESSRKGPPPALKQPATPVAPGTPKKPYDFTRAQQNAQHRLGVRPSPVPAPQRHTPLRPPLGGKRSS